MELLVATRNKKKLKEIKEILNGLGLKIKSLTDYKQLPRIKENGRTFKENAVKKAVKIAGSTKKLCMGEDSGLCVNVLHGKPGIYSSRFSGKDKNDLKNNLKLLKLLGRIPLHKRIAHYTCCVALADRHGLIGAVEGKCYGIIGFEQKGHFGFGYDPLFIIPKYGKTFAQLGPGIKHKISHRFRALEKARKLLQKYIEQHKKG
ncbi:MAG: hypothetical protein AMJ95_13220 [Omnitrophica WOR_2 bacterium SM23_72]|nr:MAG: hypothetical protein AMJ95_13220 [Omnitrophica WOR_2 bacterium SM23_72]